MGSEVRNKVEQLLQKLPLSEQQRQLYLSGASMMSEESLKGMEQELDEALQGASEGNAAMDRLLAGRPAPKALVAVENAEYRDQLVDTLGSHFDVEPVDVANVPDAIRRTDFSVVIFDFTLPLVRRWRDLTRHVSAVTFVRTSTDDELGKVAASGASAYSTSGSAADLGRAVLSAVQEQASARVG